MGQPASIAKSFSSFDRSGFPALAACPPPLPFEAFGVGQPSAPIEPLADVGRPCARCAGIENPEGVIRCVQVISYKVEPSEAVNRRYLLAKDALRSSCFDEAKEVWPKMPWIVLRGSFAGAGEGSARAGAGPDGAVGGPSGKGEGVVPNRDACKEMHSGESPEVVGGNKFN